MEPKDSKTTNLHEKLKKLHEADLGDSLVDNLDLDRDVKPASDEEVIVRKTVKQPVSDEMTEDEIKEKGWKVNDDGDLVNKDDHLIDMDGKLIDAEGYFVDEDGQPVDEKGEPIVDEEKPAEEPAAEETATEEPATEEPAAEETATEEPAAEEEGATYDGLHFDEDTGWMVDSEGYLIDWEGRYVDVKGVVVTDAAKKIKGGKVVKVTAEQAKAKKKPRGGLSPAQHKARIGNLKKARLKAHSPAAEKKRKKSMALRKKKGLSSSLEVDFEKIGDELREKIQAHFTDTYDLTKEQVDSLVETLVNDHFELEIVENDGKEELQMNIPVWDDSGQLDKFETKEAVFACDDGLDHESIMTGIVDDWDLLTKCGLGEDEEAE